jgi:hypothetical protein
MIDAMMGSVSSQMQSCNGLVHSKDPISERNLGPTHIAMTAAVTLRNGFETDERFEGRT